jgi:DNA-binding transcriptional LysR family regulator
MSDRFQQLNVFVRVAEGGSFSRTARELGLAQSSISRIVFDLEERLGVKLLLRTTRQVVPTDAGITFLHRARRLLEEMEVAEDAARGIDSLRGTLRIAMPGKFGVGEIIPRLPAFLAEHPALRIRLLPSDEPQDLIEGGVDVAIRFGRLPDSNFGSRKLATVRRLLVAAPVYLAARGTPNSPADLIGHDCLFGPGMSARGGWRFAGADEHLQGSLDGRLQVASLEGLMASAVAGLGIAIGSTLLCRTDLASGALVTLLQAYPLDPIDLHAVYPAGRQPSRKVRAFVDYIAAAFA